MMNTRATATLLATLAMGPVLAACGEPTAPAAPPLTELPRDLSTEEVAVMRASNAFAIDLLREAVVDDAAAPNVFLSPLSASMALGMTMNGADGETWTQMRDMLGFEGLEETEVNAAYRGLIDLLVALDPAVELGLGNAIFPRQGYPVLPDFYDRVRASFDAEVRPLDFADPGAVEVINAWVEDVTRGRIEEMVTAIPGNVVMYLLNAVYFKGDWTSRFDPGSTTTAPFTLADGGTVQVPLMRQTGTFRTFGTERARGVELPYGGQAFTAVAVLPAHGVSVRELVAGLDAEEWASWTAALDGSADGGEVAVALPRFELEYELVLNGTLQALGMEDAFTPGADFTRMVEGGGVWVDQVKQKTFLRVDEEGTEAAAATSVSMVESVGGAELRFDRPFLFAIRERLTGTVLFLGVIGHPGG